MCPGNAVPVNVKYYLALSIAKMLSGWNAFEISDIQDLQLSHPKPGDQHVTMLHRVENRQMELLRSTG
jgi:hypothetical protein